MRALARARKELEAGRVVALFPEGQIARDGKLAPFLRGYERIVDKLDYPLIAAKPKYFGGFSGLSRSRNSRIFGSRSSPYSARRRSRR